MASWGAFILGGGLIALAMYVHKRNLTWVALGLALIAGVLIAVSTIGGWMRDLGGHIPYLPLLLVLAAAAVIGLDLRDKRPDKPAVILMMIVPTFFAVGLGQLPDLFDLISSGLSNMGTTSANGQ